MNQRTDNQKILETHIGPQTFVHAYGLEGESEPLIADLSAVCEAALRVRTSGNPDFQIARFGVLGIEDARALERRALERPFGGAYMFFVLAFDSITHEAQNALLKLFEDPSPSARFFLIMPSREVLLPTLRSRLYLISLRNTEGAASDRIEQFVRAAPAERLQLLKPLIESKDKAEAIRFLNELEGHLHAHSRRHMPERALRQALRDIIRARGYLEARSPSVKMLLEGVALTLSTLHESD